MKGKLEPYHPLSCEDSFHFLYTAVVKHPRALEGRPVTAQDLKGMNREQDMTEHKPVSSLAAFFMKGH